MSIFFLILHGLVNAGLYKDLLAATVAFTVARVLAWRPLKRHQESQDKIANLLDTRTPGGLSDVVQAMSQDSDDENIDTPDNTGSTGHNHIPPPHVR